MLECFLVDWMGDGLYRMRTQLSGGSKGNGFEMWRWLYQEYQGGSDAVNLGGTRRLQDWSRCTKLESLSQHLDEWTECLTTHCAELLHAPGVLRSMLLGVIPQDFEDELLGNPQIKSWQEIIQWCKVKTVYKRQKILAEAARRPGHRVNSVLASIEAVVDTSAEAEAQPAPFQQAPEGTPAWFQDYINRLEKARPKAPRKPDASKTDAVKRKKSNIRI